MHLKCFRVHYRVMEHAGSLRFFSLFLPHLRTQPKRKGRKIVFVLGLVGRVYVCIHYCRKV